MLKKSFSAMTLFFMFSLSVWASSLDTVKAIRHDLNTQVTTWNRGDVHTFVKSYKNSNATLYIANPVVRGYKNILAHYLIRYPTKEAMGKLSLDIIAINVLSPHYAMVIAKWHLIRKKLANIGGICTLLYERTPEGWKIVIDHTS